MIACAEEHLGTERAGRYLRKFYPWYAERLELPEAAPHRALHGAHDGRSRATTLEPRSPA